APEPGLEIDYTTLRSNCRAFAGLLHAAGIPRGATVSFMVDNGLTAATVFLGAIYGGYVVSPINLLAQDAQLEYSLTHSESRIVFAAAANRLRLEAIRARTGATFDIRVVSTDGIEMPVAAPRLPTDRAGQPAMLMYTSVTTGTPK